MLGTDGKYIFGTAKVGERGQIVIPKEAREVMGIHPGDTLLILGDEKQGLAIVNLNSEALARLTAEDETDK
ncbi:MAG: AbrB/MazE/SpoVT family DNA-binding domain-containing protein [Eubacteriales bacterium]|nr:AbrB/MazE/SpoVT family DNA-binding domain-containing protein [Eubacteriales bacterium]